MPRFSNLGTGYDGRLRYTGDALGANGFRGRTSDNDARNLNRTWTAKNPHMGGTGNVGGEPGSTNRAVPPFVTDGFQPGNAAPAPTDVKANAMRLHLKRIIEGTVHNTAHGPTRVRNIPNQAGLAQLLARAGIRRDTPLTPGMRYELQKALDADAIHSAVKPLVQDIIAGSQAALAELMTTRR